MMAEAAPRAAATRKASSTAKSSAIYLAEALRIRRERRFGRRDPGPDAETSNVVYMSRGPRSRPRVKRFRRGAAPYTPSTNAIWT